MKKSIPVILPSLAARGLEETPQLVPFKPGLLYQHMVLGRNADGYVDDIVSDIKNLNANGWIEGWAKTPRNDGYGFYISVLVNREQALGVKETNDEYRLFERGHIQAMTKASLPSWARADDDGPSHVFWGQEMPDHDGYGN